MFKGHGLYILQEENRAGGGWWQWLRSKVNELNATERCALGWVYPTKINKTQRSCCPKLQLLGSGA